MSALAWLVLGAICIAAGYTAASLHVDLMLSRALPLDPFWDAQVEEALLLGNSAAESTPIYDETALALLDAELEEFMGGER